MCQIESAEAVEKVTAIAAVEDVDMMFVGPFELLDEMFLGGR